MITSQMSTSYKTGPVDWRQEASRTIMRHHIYAVLLQRYEDQLASQESVRALQSGEAAGEESCPWQQSRRTLWYNVGEIESEMYSGSVTGEQYYARLTTVMQSDLFPDWGELGMRRWCLQGGFSVCKEIVQMDQSTMLWAEALDEEQFSARICPPLPAATALAIPVNELELRLGIAVCERERELRRLVDQRKKYMEKVFWKPKGFMRLKKPIEMKEKRNRVHKPAVRKSLAELMKKRFIAKNCPKGKKRIGVGLGSKGLVMMSNKQVTPLSVPRKRPQATDLELPLGCRVEQRHSASGSNRTWKRFVAPDGRTFSSLVRLLAALGEQRAPHAAVAPAGGNKQRSQKSSVKKLSSRRRKVCNVGK